MVELEDIVKRRDYKLKPYFLKNCKKCPSNYLTLMRHDNTIGQWCSNCRSIFNISRVCTFCNQLYDFDDMECIECEKIITEIAAFEVCIEDNEKTLRRLSRKHKRGEIPETVFLNQRQICQEEILKCKEELEKVKAIRRIEQLLESPMQKQ